MSENLPNVVISEHKGNIPGILHSTKAGREAIHNARSEQDIKGELRTVLKCAKIIRRVVHRTRKNKLWTFAGSLDGTGGQAIPV